MTVRSFRQTMSSMQTEPCHERSTYTRVCLEVDLTSQPIRGTLSSETGARKAFVGWLGLTTALCNLQDVRNETGGDEDG